LTLSIMHRSLKLVHLFVSDRSGGTLVPQYDPKTSTSDEIVLSISNAKSDITSNLRR
jgi:hypothetical protein